MAADAPELEPGAVDALFKRKAEAVGTGTGGDRPGSGMKSKKSTIPPKPNTYEFFIALMNDPNAGERVRLEAAKCAQKFELKGVTGKHGKKGERRAAAESAASGRFALPAQPRGAKNST